MVNRNLLNQYDVSDDDLIAVMGDQELIDETAWLEGEDVSINQIVEGKVIRIDNEFVVVDVGYKSEGLIPLSEWEPEIEEDPYGNDPEATDFEPPVVPEPEEPPKPGDIIRVLVEDVEDVAGRHDERGMLVLSKRKAERIEQWMGVMSDVHEGDVVTGTVIRKIKGGLLVDIGVNVFLPASQVDIRRPHDIGEYIGKEIKCMVLKIDEERRNIVVSRRSLIEQERATKKAELLKTLSVGDIRKGIVKNIADFGAFVDLGGIDGLLHITDMSWGRINHPSEMVKIEDNLEVMVLHIDYEREKIALGLKQKSPSPWEKVPATYPVGTRVKGHVVNVMSYGAFVKLEDGIEGLVHISEMSWTKRISHPSELVQVDDEVEVVVLGINQEKQEISLGMKQTQDNPWDRVADRYPPGADVEGRVRNLTNYGAFIEIEEGIDGLLHVSDMSWTRKVSHPSEVVEKGELLKCKILSVDTERRRIALGMKQLDEDPWSSDIPNRFQPGDLVKGKVTKITNFGVFIGLEDGLEGLLHVSELSDQKIENPEEICNVGDEMEVKILRVDIDERKIGLSRKRVDWAEEEAGAEGETEAVGATSTASSASNENLKGGIGSGEGPLFKAPTADVGADTDADSDSGSED
ncbi:30S ribosomal protein S1 [Botrimarina mediterranea]|uniref:Small ribosomal subunit protein bS1 n=1 Tax=Botrimarina mediterranea TaxID=2528022 RepID=A0A518K5C5_9BACT|nr:30S ribosomal protein S1 [Botrimarina mediterranea]QDV73002.1 30S ribosomal protein S1 [Botrimarina mediterranea]QDV77576.1 30S ribosomal protein S1 [Planctomycetes bacterium K2D]